MPSHEIIDLLSSDEDRTSAPPATLQAEKKVLPPTKGGFLDLGDNSDLDEILFSAQSPKQKSMNSGASRTKKRPEDPEFDDFQADEVGFAVSKRRKLSGSKDGADPIIFTSSPQGTLSTSLLRRRILGSPFSSGSDVDDPASNLRTTRPPLRNTLSDRTANLLADIIGNTKTGQKRASAGNKAKSCGVRAGKGKARQDTQRSRSPSVAQSDVPGKPSRKEKARQTDAERDLKERERALKEKEKELEKREREVDRLRKAAAKDDEKERKRAEKEAKAKEKLTATVLAEVNRSSTDKKLSAKEMIVDLPSSIHGQKVDVLIREFLKNYDVEATTLDSVIPNVIKWRRKVARRFNEEMKHWEPAPPSIQPEKHVMCLLSAKEFVALAAPKSADDEDLEAHVARLKATHTGCKLIYLIEGLNTLMRKAKNSKNRAYQAAVLSQMDPAGEAGSTASTSRRKKAQEVGDIDEDIVEDALLRLQVMQGCLIQQTPTTVETAELVCSFTMQISTIPDKLVPLAIAENDSDNASRMQRAQLQAGFCMDVGQVRTGDGKEDTYYKMLQQIVRVTPAVASGIAVKYPDVLSLVKGMRKHGPCALEDLEVGSCSTETMRGC